MSVFTIFSSEQKTIAEEKEFDNYIEAGKYVKEKYTGDFKAKVNAFNFNNEFKSMLLDGEHESILVNDRREKVVIILDNIAYHCGKINWNDQSYLNRLRVKSTWISKEKWITMHNELIKSKLN